jgi:MerR family transcriptional regulator/heat shock protein HspR
MRFYTRRRIVELLHVEEGFVETLEQEEVIQIDAPVEAEGEFSERMLERVRVADTLVRDLDVNLAGVAIIIRLREEMADLRTKLGSALQAIRQGRS